MTSTPIHTRRRAVLRALAAGAMLSLALTGCTATADKGSELKTGDNLEASSIDWRLKMDDCMLEAGFDMTQSNADGTPSDTLDTSQFDMVAFDDAYDACGTTVGEPPVDESLPTAEETFESQLIFAACMRDLGYDYPDPVKSDGGMTQAFGPETNPDDMDSCSAKANEQGEK